MSPPKEKARLGRGPSLNFSDESSLTLDLDSIYPVPAPIDGGERSFGFDIDRMSAGQVRAEILGALLRLNLEPQRAQLNRSWLRRRLRRLEARRLELRRPA